MSDKITAYKAFDADMSCRGFQYEVGKTYMHEGDVSLCESGFHACLVPFDCWSYYGNSNTFARATLDGVADEIQNDSKRVASMITIEATLSLPEWVQAQVDAVLSLCGKAEGALSKGGGECAAATGYSGHAAATGRSGHAAATGYSGHAAATGDYGHAAAEGDNSIAASLGIKGSAQGALGTWLVLAEHDNERRLIGVKTAPVDGEKIKPGTAYSLQGGEFVEVGQ